MKTFGTRKVFPNPGDLGDIPGVNKRTPIPVRDTPLPGTKTMLCPKDDQVNKLVSGRSIEVSRPSRTAKILGGLAMGIAKLVRPNKPGGEKGVAYECRELPVGS